MDRITPNKLFIEKFKQKYSAKTQRDLFDFFDYILSDQVQPFDVYSQEELTKHIGRIALELTTIHITNKAMRIGKLPTDDDFNKFRFETLETVLLILAFVPIVRLDLTSNSKTNNLAMFNYFEQHAGTYQFDTTYFDELVVTINSHATISTFKSCNAMLQTIAPKETEQKRKDLVVVGNGIYNKETKTLEPFRPDYVTTTKIATDYNPNAQLTTITNPDGTTWDVESWLKDLAGNISNEYDDDTYKLFWEIIASVINPDQVNAKAIFFYSSVGNNGKGTFGQLLKNLVGQKNYSSLSIPAFKHEFMKEQLLGKTLNIADENPVDIYVDDVQDFKAMITGDDIMINRKHEKPIVAQVKAINIQMLNGLPKTRDKSDSFYRRLIIVPFSYSFTNNGERPYIKHDYMYRTEVLEYVLKRALELDPFSEFTVPSRSEVALNQYKEDNNSAVEFWNYFENQFTWDFIPQNFLYKLYVAWFQDEHGTERGSCFSKKTFLAHIENHLKTNDLWEFRANRTTCPNPLRINGRMDADEPLITEYKLTDFYDPDYKGSDPELKRKFQRVERGRGIIRVTAQSNSTN